MVNFIYHHNEIPKIPGTFIRFKNPQSGIKFYYDQTRTIMRIYLDQFLTHFVEKKSFQIFLKTQSQINKKDQFSYLEIDYAKFTYLPTGILLYLDIKKLKIQIQENQYLLILFPRKPKLNKGLSQYQYSSLNVDVLETPPSDDESDSNNTMELDKHF